MTNKLNEELESLNKRRMQILSQYRGQGKEGKSKLLGESRLIDKREKEIYIERKEREKQWKGYKNDGGTMTLDEWEMDGRYDPGA